MEPVLNCRYIAGLWDYQLELQLLWYYFQSWRKAPVYKAPSWSWASSPGEVRYRSGVNNIRNLRLDLFTVLSIEAESPAEDNLSPVFEGRLRVIGKLTPVTLFRNSELSDSEEVKEDWRDYKVKIRNNLFQFSPDIQYTPGRYYSTTLKYHVQANRRRTSVAGLVWKATGRKRGEFQRVGLFKALYDPPFTVKELQDLEFCLCGRGDVDEKAEITEELYESYDKEKDVYNFSII